MQSRCQHRLYRSPHVEVCRSPLKLGVLLRWEPPTNLDELKGLHLACCSSPQVKVLDWGGDLEPWEVGVLHDVGPLA
jgi:hypothetical protein